MHSALDHPEVIRAYLTKKQALGRMLGHFLKLAIAQSLQHCHINTLSITPTGRNTERRHLITDLSHLRV
jgi:hypothetical protein